MRRTAGNECVDPRMASVEIFLAFALLGVVYGSPLGRRQTDVISYDFQYHSYEETVRSNAALREYLFRHCPASTPSVRA